MTQPPAVPVCYRHPDRETYVRCTRCNRPICPSCMNEASVGFQCPECVREGSRTQRQARTAFGGGQSGTRGTVTITLIVINVMVFLFSLVSAGRHAAESVAGGGLGGLLGGSNPLTEWGALTPYLATRTHVRVAGNTFADGDWYQLFTSMFLHYGLLHLGLNMWALWVLGRPLETALGRLRFLALYLLSGIGGGIAVLLLGAPNGATAGASGAVFGLFAALIVVLRRMKASIAGILPVLVLNLIFSFSISGVSWQGHIGGLITGGIVAFGFAYAPRERRNAIQIATVVATLVLFGIAIVAGLSSIPAVGYSA
ncbi:rhomboid family intramembrane serine protease [Dactylosporangium sp. NPDC051485]|uniref:rhomboid family intramembrane serine protease n=1 Tax=Dactylosporangium sp. NPDC051485 TaxID=3154846 RepID=UPI0034384095